MCGVCVCVCRSRESGRTRKSVVGVVRAGTPTASSTVPSTGPPPTGHSSSSSQVKAVLIRGLPGRSSGPWHKSDICVCCNFVNDNVCVSTNVLLYVRMPGL
jgi:hypothetical protein